jgi:hypothetical protein
LAHGPKPFPGASFLIISAVFFNYKNCSRYDK